jgi:hypothetical protein
MYWKKHLEKAQTTNDNIYKITYLIKPTAEQTVILNYL